MSDSPPIRDVRMKGFACRSAVADAWNWIDATVDAMPRPIGAETIPIGNAVGRVLCTDIVSRVDVPMFDRAMMDGYAVHAEDTAGASTYNRLSLSVIGEALPNRPFDGAVSRGEAVRIMTGSPIPVGADAVLPVEQTEINEGMPAKVDVLGELPPQKHIGVRGEDIRAGAKVLSTYRILRPQDIGVLSSIGFGDVDVVRPIKVRVIVTGNELLPRGSVPSGYQIVDANGPMLSAIAVRDGATIVDDSIVADEPNAIVEAMHDDVDVVLLSGGSSVGLEDHAPRLLAEQGDLVIHGLAMRPSSPSGMGRLGDRFVFLLPGNPVSCLCSYDFFAGRAIRRLAGLQSVDSDWPYVRVSLPLRRKLVSQIGRVDYARVAVVDNQVEPIAISGASMLSSTTRADGFVVVPQESEGYGPETIVDVFLYGESVPRE